MKELKTKYGFDNWYDWSNYHYGTKWGDGVRQDEVPVQVIEKDDEVIVRIETDSSMESNKSRTSIFGKSRFINR